VVAACRLAGNVEAAQRGACRLTMREPDAACLD
jgi:hypothetical protein